MEKTWNLKRTKQCEKCPWRVDTDPHEIPNGYCPAKHAHLKVTIADADNPLDTFFRGKQRSMACHEEHEAHCIGWLVNQIGPGNNIGLRMHMRSCGNVKDVQVFGEQHQRFEDTLPDGAASDEDEHGLEREIE
jgi:hypothetical protein